MSSADQLIDDLVGSLGTVYPVRLGLLSARPGRVTCVVTPVSCEYERPKLTGGTTTVFLHVDVHVQSALAGDQGLSDLLTHVDPVVALIRDAAFLPTTWRAATSADVPDIVISAIARGNG